jgi:predicted Zn-dependent protease
MDLLWPRLNAPRARITLREVNEHQERLLVRRGLVQPIESLRDAGVMVTVWLPHGMGYCASARRDASSLQEAAEHALDWAGRSESAGLFADLDLHALLDQNLSLNRAALAMGRSRAGPPARAMPERRVLIDLLKHESIALHAHQDIVNWAARLNITRTEQRLWVDAVLVNEQHAQYIEPNLEVTALRRGVAQTRTLGGQYNGFCQQGGFEVIEASGLRGAGARLADEVLQLVEAPVCPTGCLDLLLAPDQMMLQIHESIGHPLELDRILGDERNFAGGSFVTPDMFGRHAYGSALLNVSFDPTPEHELASYAVDDEGEPARRVELIREGVLLRPLGSALSRARARLGGVSLEGTANARSIGWHRPAIDRMANLNLEPGSSRFEELVAGIERGVYMRTNASWSIDDARNKFQFGCEWGQLIESGRLTTVVRNPGYRGVSADFWRSLDGVGDASTVQVLGTPFCGKGEPGQVIRVGHASPACRFRGVEVFGGAS